MTLVANKFAKNGGLGLKAVDLGKERRTLHQTSPWVVHLAPCIVEVPCGSALAKHELQCITPCRMALQKTSESSHSSWRGHADMDGAPLPLVCTPHELRPTLVASLIKKLVPKRFQPKDVIFDHLSASDPTVIFILSGSVECSLAGPAPADTGFFGVR